MYVPLLLFYKSKCGALSGGKYLLISDKGAVEEIIKDINVDWAELVNKYVMS